MRPARLLGFLWQNRYRREIVIVLLLKLLFLTLIGLYCFSPSLASKLTVGDVIQRLL